MTIATLSALHRRQKEKRFVVVCPSSLVSNWAKEFDKWLGKASQPKRVVVRKGGEAGLQQIRAFCPTKPNQSEVLIISYDLFRMNATILNQAKQIGLLIVDEGHRLKNSGGSLTLTALQGLECDARLLITGTPIQNNLTEFHTLANFVCPGLLGDLASFRKEYERSISAANSKSASREARVGGHEQSQALDKITSTFMLRRLQKDVLKTLLPPRKEFLLFCRPSQHQCRLYKYIASKAVTSSSSGGATAEALTVLTNLRKLCSHPSLLEKNGPINKDVALSGKVEVLDALLRGIKQSNPDDKIVIVSNFTSALTVIEETILMTRGLPYLRLDGTVPQAERQPLVDTFNRCSPEKAFAFLLSSKAGGCGLNLIGGKRLPLRTEVKSSFIVYSTQSLTLLYSCSQPSGNV
jgi:SNF2 family DNA or RNA helicase